MTEVAIKPSIIELPWPSRDLHPNQRVHWARRARATKRARFDAYYASISAGVRELSSESYHLVVIFHPPDNRRRDMDGMQASLKAYADGIADALGVDDHIFTWEYHRADPRPGGLVRIEVMEAA